MDNKAVHLLSSNSAIEPIDLCERWSKKQKKIIKVPRPAVVRKYNMNMGGIDSANRFNSVCPMRSRTNKWTIRMMLHFTDLAVSNAWVQYQENKIEKNIRKKDIRQLRSFKLSLGEQLIFKQESDTSDNSDSDQDPTVDLPSPSKKKKKSVVPLPPINRRKKHALHMPEILKIKTFKKCRQPGCGKLCRARCTTCDIFLCLNAERNCFILFHQI